MLRVTEGLPGVLGNKGTLAKYRREQGNISQFLGTGEQNSKNYSTKTFGKCVGTWEHRAILEGNKGTRTPLGDPRYGGKKRENSCTKNEVAHAHEGILSTDKKKLLIAETLEKHFTKKLKINEKWKLDI